MEWARHRITAAQLPTSVIEGRRAPSMVQRVARGMIAITAAASIAVIARGAVLAGTTAAARARTYDGVLLKMLPWNFHRYRRGIDVLSTVWTRPPPRAVVGVRR